MIAVVLGVAFVIGLIGGLVLRSQMLARAQIGLSAAQHALQIERQALLQAVRIRDYGQQNLLQMQQLVNRGPVDYVGRHRAD